MIEADDALPRCYPDHPLTGGSGDVGRIVPIPWRGQGRRHAGIRLWAGEQDSPNAVTKEKAAEIAADFMTTLVVLRAPLAIGARVNGGKRPPAGMTPIEQSEASW